VWKERNRRIFEGVAARPARVLQLIKDDLKLREVACGRADPWGQLFLMFNTPECSEFSFTLCNTTYVRTGFLLLLI
jgi:hypothetical protein